MKKLIMFFAAMVMTVVTFAQTNYEYTGPFGMPYVNLNAGAVMPLTNFKDFNANAIQPAAGIELGTYVTPIWGASAEGIAVFNLNKGADQTLLDRHYVLGNGKMNVSNFLAGYKGYPRRVEFVLVAGAGWERNYWKVPANAEEIEANPETPVDYKLAHADGMVYNTGAEINVNLGEKRAWQINVRPSVIWGHNAENQFGFNPQNATARLNVGITYKFGNRRVKSHNFVTNNYAVTQHDYDVLMAKYEECHNRPAEVKEVPVEKLVEKEVVKTVDVLTYFGETYILFPSGNKTLNADAKARLDQFAKHVDGKVYVNVLGSADSKTGSKSYNYDLAAARAKAVKDYLVKKCNIAEEDVVINTTLDATDTIKTSRSAVLTIVVKDEN